MNNRQGLNITSLAEVKNMVLRLLNTTKGPVKDERFHFLYLPSLWSIPVSTVMGQHQVRFCPPGPSDVHIHWLINGHSLDTPIMEYRQPVGQREVLVSSWLREGPLIKDARYQCVAEASTGNDMSEVDLRLTIGGIWCWVALMMSGVQSIMVFWVLKTKSLNKMWSLKAWRVRMEQGAKTRPLDWLNTCPQMDLFNGLHP